MKKIITFQGIKNSLIKTRDDIDYPTENRLKISEMIHLLSRMEHVFYGTSILLLFSAGLLLYSLPHFLWVLLNTDLIAVNSIDGSTIFKVMHMGNEKIQGLFLILILILFFVILGFIIFKLKKVIISKFLERLSKSGSYATLDFNWDEKFKEDCSGILFLYFFQILFK